MRILCPHCGERGSEEFTYLTAADRTRPEPGAPLEAWHDYVNLRDNPAGLHREHWHHIAGCRRWITVTRNTRTHEITATEDAVPFQLPLPRGEGRGEGLPAHTAQARNTPGAPA